ncbi:MAG: FAD-dependent monooxygenase [Aestuariivirga sp.]
MKRKQITVLGGGIAGLSAAIALEKTGHLVTILEKTKSFDLFGAGLQLGPNAVRALQKLGVWDAVEPISSSPPALHFRSAVNGRLLNQVPLGQDFVARFGQPYRIAHRADLHEALLGVVKSKDAITLKMGQDVNPLQMKGPVIAADGMWSKTREMLFPGIRPQKLPITIFRALIDVPQIAGIDMSCVNLWMYKNAHFVHYPIANRNKLNIVAVAAEPGPHAAFANAHALPRSMLNLVKSFTPWTAAVLPPLPQWHKDNILLIGDAAHGTVPFLAQGAAMALEDAAALMDTTDPVTFTNMRAARCVRLSEQTVSTGDIYHFAGLKALARDTLLRFNSHDLLIERVGWIYRGA